MKSRGDTTRVSPVELKLQADTTAAKQPRLHNFAKTSSNGNDSTVTQDDVAGTRLRQSLS